VSDTIRSDQAAAAEWARDLLSRKDWVILDTETCGLYEMAHICEIAIIRPDGSELLNTRVRPAIPIPPEATAIHGITDDQVAAAPTIGVVAGRLTALLEGVNIIVTYNAEFDWRALVRSLAAGGDSDWRGWTEQWRWQCAMTWYSQWYGDWWAGRYRYQRLDGVHSALEDCRACLQRIQQMAGDDWATLDTEKKPCE
jgi:DNA polymerase III subunit epsilon